MLKGIAKYETWRSRTPHMERDNVIIPIVILLGLDETVASTVNK